MHPTLRYFFVFPVVPGSFGLVLKPPGLRLIVAASCQPVGFLVGFSLLHLMLEFL